LSIADTNSAGSTPDCGATWLASLQQIAQPTTGQTIGGIQIVSWNDYESSQQIEAGIDNCLSITPALTGSTLSWQVTGNTAAIDHYAVFTSTDGTTLTPIGSVPPTTATFNLAAANLPPAIYTIFIQAVGKPSVLNKVSPAVLYAAKQPPTVAVSVSPTSGSAPLAVNASITSSAATGSVISSNSINFGDGTVVNTATASHTYNSAGTYTVTATATDNNKLSSTATATVTVAASLQPPTAKLTVTPTSGTAPLAVSASTAGSTDPNTGGSITSTTINFGDGTVVNTATASHTYNSAGTYTVTAKVTDNNNLSSTVTATVTVAAALQPPTAKLSVTPTSGAAPLAVSASTAGSSDPNTGGSITSTTINFGDGTVVNAATASHTYNSAGTYTVTATVTDNNNLSSTATATVVAGTSSPPPPSSGQTAVTLNVPGGAQTFHLGPHPRVMENGPASGTSPVGDVLRAAMDSSSTGRFNTNNPIYNRLLATWTTNCNPSLVGSLNAYTAFDGSAESDECGVSAALLWQANGSKPSDTTYLPMAQWVINDAESFYGGSIGCNESMNYCGGRTSWQDYSRQYAQYLALTYSIVRSTLTSAQIQAFADKMLNGNAQSARTAASNVLCGNTPYTGHCGNGTGGNYASVNVDCVNQGMFAGAGTISISGNSLTGVGTSFTSIGAGGALLATTAGAYDGPNQIYGRIASITSNTSATLSRSERTVTSVPYVYSPQWVQNTGSGVGNCGVVWWWRHHMGTFRSVPGQESNWTIDYPPSSGTGVSWPWDANDKLSEDANNQVWTELMGELSIAIALADDDPRAVYLLQTVWNWMYQWEIPGSKSLYTGFANSAAQYTTTRVHPFTDSIAIMFCNSFVETGTGSPCALLTGGNWMERQIPYYLYMVRNETSAAWPTANPNVVDDWGGVANGGQPNFQQWAACELQYLFPSDPYLPYMTYAQRSLPTSSYGAVGSAGGNTMTQDVYSNYLFCNPAQTQTNVTGAQKQFLFQDTDYAQVAANSAWNGYGYANSPIAHFVSLTGWGVTDTRIQGDSGFYLAPSDHDAAVQPGHYQIFKNNEGLLRWDAGDSDGTVYQGPASNTIALGSDTNWTSGGPNWQFGYAKIARWAGSDPSGDPNNNYTYAMMDLNPSGTTGAYMPSANASRVNRHLIHFKKAGDPDYVLDYDDVAVTSAETLKSYWHYGLHALAAYTDATITPSTKTAQVIHTTNARLNSQFLTVARANSMALVVGNANGSYTNGGGATARAYTCASTDGATCSSALSSYEVIAVHQPCANTTCTMPTITQPTCSGTGGNCTAVQIADASSPKVAVFARQGSLLSGAAFTTTHSGTAQYVIAGLSPGTYNVTVGSNTVISGATVNANDNSLYFESTAGAVQVK
jgi:PKD repeat protein